MVNSNELVDREKRHLNYLRISVTDRCNLRCLYCVPDGRIPKLDHSDILSFEEILRILKIGIKLGIKKVRVTGGEPLMRKGVVAFLGQLARIKELKDVSLTTNGVLLSTYAQEIFNAGIRRINVSLDSLNPINFATITGYDQFHRVWEGIEKAHGIGFSPMKMNVVAMRGINDNEILDFAELSFKYPFHIRFIEYMPIGNSRTQAQNQILTPEIMDRVSSLGKLIAIDSGYTDGPARRYRIEGAKGEIGFISALSHHFCNHCNRLRLTADGKLRACLLSDDHLPVKAVLRSGGLDEEITDIFRSVAKQKATKHRLSPGGCSVVVRDQMQGIGG
jgi:cyclic pyranopterin phosphate synthase